MGVKTSLLSFEIVTKSIFQITSIALSTLLYRFAALVLSLNDAPLAPVSQIGLSERHLQHTNDEWEIEATLHTTKLTGHRY